MTVIYLCARCQIETWRVETDKKRRPTHGMHRCPRCEMETFHVRTERQPQPAQLAREAGLA